MRISIKYYKFTTELQHILETSTLFHLTWFCIFEALLHHSCPVCIKAKGVCSAAKWTAVSKVHFFPTPAGK